jgi:SAM-dependent methyltransferase
MSHESDAGMIRPLLAAVLFFNRKAKRLAIRLVRWTGKSPEAVHPKHLLGAEHYWYLAHIPRWDDVIDIGCGHGAHSLRAARVARWVHGIDRDPAAIEAASRASARLNMQNTSFVVMDCEQPLPIITDAFDVALCLDLLEHVENRAQLLSEIHRILSPEGRLLLAVPNRGTSWKRRLARAGLDPRSDPDHKCEYLFPELAGELACAGFVITDRVPAVADTPLVGVIDLIGGLSLACYARLTAWRCRRGARHPDEQAGFYVVCRRTP